MALLTGEVGTGRTRRLVRAFAGAAGLVVILWTAGTAPGHVGNRLRMGYRHEPTLEAIARLTEMYVEAVSGFTIDLKAYSDPFALQEAVREEKVDVAVEYPAEAWARTTCPTGGALVENMYPRMKAYYQEKFGAVWVGAFAVRREEIQCCAPSYVITRGVAEDLAYYTLPRYLKKLLDAISQEDLDSVLSRNPRGDDAGLLRDLLARKKLI